MHRSTCVALAGSLAGLVLASAAHASFTVSIPTSASAALIGNVNNGVTLYTYSGPTILSSSLSFAGDITDGGVGSSLSQARWNVRNTSFINSINYQPATGGPWTGTQSAAATFNVNHFVRNGDVIRFESFESNNQAGIDATWNNASFTFNDAAIMPLGTLAAGLNTFDTDGSFNGPDRTDTEIALYDGDGLLIATNDDIGPTNFNSILNETLGNGSYFLAVSGYNSTFVPGYALAGTAVGNFVLNVNGSNVATGALTPGVTNWYSFNIPAPGAGVLAGAALVGVVRRRRA